MDQEQFTGIFNSALKNQAAYSYAFFENTLGGSESVKRRSHLVFFVNLYIQVNDHITKTTVKYLDLCSTDYLNFEVEDADSWSDWTWDLVSIPYPLKLASGAWPKDENDIQSTTLKNLN